MMRQLLWRSAERVLPAHQALRRVRAAHSRDLLVLAFHNVVPDAAPLVGDLSLHFRLTEFCALIDRLLEACTPVKLFGSESVGEGPRFAVTFDDAYRGSVTLALPELARRAVPSTTFVPTSMLGDRTFWWDSLARPGGELDPRLRNHALGSLQGDDALIREWATGQGATLQDLPAEWHTSTVAELRAAAQSDLVALAPHSATHRAMDRLDEGELGHELTEPLKWFRAQEIPFWPCLAYPYGRCSPAVREAAAAVGYESAWLVSGGWEGRGRPDAFMRPRLNVPAGASTRRLIWRVANAGRSH